jgi:energy-coupling factor transporter ATP-binding protein EcfA2
MLKSLSIRQFRGIETLELKDFGRVNIFLGTNGSGKTTVLEALGIAANPTNGRFLVAFCEWREMNPPSLANNTVLRSYFRNLDLTVPPRLEFSDEDGDHELSLTPSFEAVPIIGFSPPGFSSTSSSSSSTEFAQSFAGSGSGTGTGSGEPPLRGLDLNYEGPGGQSAQAKIQLFDNGYQATPPLGTVPKRGCFYVHARRATSSGETADLISRLYEAKRESQLLDLLKQVDGRVTRLQPSLTGNSKAVLVDVGLPQMIQMNLLGDGFCRVALMATGLMYFGAKTLNVDEIDSGLHHSVMKVFWDNAIRLTRSQDRQVFCTTHSEEMLQSTLEAFSSSPDDLRIFRIDRHKNGQVTAQKYSYGEYTYAEKSGVDIR